MEVNFITQIMRLIKTLKLNTENLSHLLTVYRYIQGTLQFYFVFVLY